MHPFFKGVVQLNEIFIERRKEMLRIAIKENSKLKECLIEEENDDVYAGQIYKGKVQNIVPAIKCAFVDIGREKNAYIYMDSKYKNKDMKKGDELIVQIVKEEIGNKGPKVSNIINIPGRYCVLNTMSTELEFSKKIEDQEFKTKIGEKIVKPCDVGIMIRTNAIYADVENLNDEIVRLDKIYREIKRKAEFALKPGILFDDGGILGKVLRDKTDCETNAIYVDDKKDFEYINGFLAGSSEIRAKCILHNDIRTLFDYHGIEKEIMKLRRDKVYLECGGHINIDKTEAMYVIDVNSGKNIKGNSIEKTAYKTNLQAAYEIARQIKLRNLSGIILVDFIDMSNEAFKKEIIDNLRNAFKDDKSKTTVYDFTELNLVQISRRRIGKPVSFYIEENCTECSGNGKRFKFSYLCLLIKNEIARLSGSNQFTSIHITLNKAYEKDVSEDIDGFIMNIGAEDKTVYLSFYKGESFKLEPVIFENQLRSLEHLKIHG